MNRPCDTSVRCVDPFDLLLGDSSQTPRPAVPQDRGIVWGNPDAGIAFGNPEAGIAFGISMPYCVSIKCPGDDFNNYSTECADVDYLADRLLCTCLADFTNLFVRAPGIGPFTWAVNGLPDGLTALVDHPCTGILNLKGTIATPGRYYVSVTVTDGFGNPTQATVQFNVIQITTTSLPGPVIGTPYSAQMTAVGGSGHFAWRIASGALPPGVGLVASGLITGIPTSSDPTQATIEVIDTECETPDKTFFVPFVVLSGASSTTIAKIIGFAQFGDSVPPKAYRTLTWAGSVMRAQPLPGKIFRTYFMNYCGATSIDLNGNQVSARTEQGYFETGNTGGPITLNGPCFFGNVVGNAILSAQFNVLPQAFLNGPTVADRDSVYGFAGEAGYTVVLSQDQAEKHATLTIGGGITQVDRIVTLTDEYTDADALAVASMLFGTGLVAESLPRTTGYISTWTTVQFSLACNNLMPGQPYVVSVELLHSDGSVTTVNYPFTAVTTDNTITDTIPTPADGTWIAAQNATINLA